MEMVGSMAVGSSSNSRADFVAPGYRFHPTDEELVRYYLTRKVCAKPFINNAIGEIDIYKTEPRDLPGKSMRKTRDLEWYFFSVLDKKYGNGSKTNRATDRGYWKTTGKDRAVYHKSQTVGMKKTLVFHSGRAPRGERTNWVMHEYRLVDADLDRSGIAQDAFVLCRVFQKSGSGPKLGEQYGAPFVEEEWESDELETISKEEAAVEAAIGDDAYWDGIELEMLQTIPEEEAAVEGAIGDDAFLDGIELEQIIWDDPIQLNFSSGDSHNRAKEYTDFIVDGTQNMFVDVDQNPCVPEQPDDKNLFDLAEQYDVKGNPVKHEYMNETSDTVNPVEVDYLLEEPYLDASDNLQFDGAAYLETEELPDEADPSGYDMLQEYLTSFGVEGDNIQYMGSDSEMLSGSENLVSDQASLSQMPVDGGTQQAEMAYPPIQQLLEVPDNKVESSSKQELAKSESDSQNPLVKLSRRILGDIPAPPALASELPAEDGTLRLNSPTSSSSVRVTAGMIQIGNMSLSARGTDWLCSKHNVNIVLAFDVSSADGNSGFLEPMVSELSGKARSSISWGWFYAMFFWVVVVSMSFKIGGCIFTR